MANVSLNCSKENKISELSSSLYTVCSCLPDFYSWETVYKIFFLNKRLQDFISFFLLRRLDLEPMHIGHIGVSAFSICGPVLVQL